MKIVRNILPSQPFIFLQKYGAVDRLESSLQRVLPSCFRNLNPALSLSQRRIAKSKVGIASKSVGAIMLKSKLLQVGSLMVKEFARGRFTTTTRRGYVQGHYSHYLQPLKLRPFSTSTANNACEEENQQTEKISVTFVNKDGEEKQIKVPIGMSMLEAAHENDIELEGACEGSLACSTCHVIVMDVNYYNKLEDPTDEENDMLDLAFGLSETSRLGCQVIAKPELDGIRLALPAATRNFAVDGYVPKPH